MNCVELLSGPIAQVIDEAKRDTGQVVVFLHIPKTGGTSIQRDLRVQFSRNIHVPCHSLEKTWHETIKRLNRGCPDIIRGHLNHFHIRELRRIGYSVRAVSYLRDPLDRLLSEFFWRQKKFPGRFGTSDNLNSFAKFFSSKRENPMCKTLVGECSNPNEAIDKVIDQYWFIGLTEFYHACQTVLFSALGKDYRIRQRLNSTGAPDDDLNHIKDVFLERAKEKMSIDFAIYEHFQDLWSGKLNEIIEVHMKVNRGLNTGVSPCAAF